MEYLADTQYLAIKPETSEGVAVIPTTIVPLVSESVKTVLNHTPDRRINGGDWEASDILRGNRMHEGDIVVLGDADVLQHFINMTMTKGTTTGDATDGYTHPNTVGNGDSYTIEVSRGEYAQRLFGVFIETLKIDFTDNQMQLTASVKAMGQIGVMTLGVALTGSAVTEVILDDEYDLDPSRGLVAGDIIVVGGTECTVVSVSATAVTVSSVSPTATAGSMVYLKPQTPSLTATQDPFYLGNALVGFGADETEATSNAGARATATPVYDLSIELRNNLFSQNGSNRFDPVKIRPKSRSASVTAKQLFETSDQRQKWMDRVKQAMTIIIDGKNINPDFSTKEQTTFKFNNVKLLENDNALEVGEMIFDDQTFEVLYDITDGKAMTCDVTNNTAGTDY